MAKLKKILLILMINFILIAQVYCVNATNSDELKISYCTHVEDYGWQSWKQNGQMAGTEGQSKRLEAIKIKCDNLPDGVKLQYQVHVQDIGWQSWKQTGEIAGTTGKNKRLEGIRIKLVNMPEYTVEYRVHVQDIGWQSWKQDGAMAGTTGKSKRIEAIEMRIVERKDKGAITVETNLAKQSFYDKISISGWKMSNVANTKLKVLIDDEDVTENAKITYKERTDIEEKILYGSSTENAKPGFTISMDTGELSAGKHSLKIQLVTQDEKKVLATYTNNITVDKNIHIEYKTHVQDYGWNSFVADGTTSGTVGKSKRLEAATIKAYNLPESMKLSFIGHVQDYGWLSWKKSGETIGTIGESKRLEAFKMKLEGTDEYSIVYRAHVQDYGWQDWSYDGEMAGTIGESKRVEAIQIKVTEKVKGEKIRLGFDEIPSVLTNEIHTITGWCMTNISNTKMQLLMDGSLLTENFKRTRDQSIYNQIKGYGGEELNPTPRATTNIDFSQYSLGNHTLTMRVLSKNGTVLAEQSRTVTIKKKITVETGIYGVSGLKINGNSNGQDLRYYKIGNGPNVFFATFAIHGWEDDFNFDGKELTKIAEALKDRLISMQDYSLADKWTIYIFPSLNPDGEYHGWSHNGPGRTTLYSAAPKNKGIDMNRTWSADWTKYTSTRNYNGTAAFQAYEARSLRDFLLAHKSTNGQTVLVDLHGWLNETIGDYGIGSYYLSTLGMSKHISSYGRGYLINWAKANLGSNGKQARSALVELPEAYSSSQVSEWGLADKYINATINMLRGI